MLDVLEHVLAPQFLIDSMSRILKENGIIYFHTPVVTKTDIFMHYLLKLPLLRIWINVDLFLIVSNSTAIRPHLSAKLGSSFSSATIYNLPPSFCCHTSTKTMTSFSYYSARLICPLHYNILYKKWLYYELMMYKSNS